MLTLEKKKLEVPPELWEAWDRFRNIVKYGEPVLRQVAKPVTRINNETQLLVRRMIDTMRDANGLGLAAPQVGVSARVIVYDPLDKKGVRVLINPVILSMSGEQLEPEEGCLSIPGLVGKVKRAQEIKIKGYDERNHPIVRRVSGLEARVIQHEVDHLNGILFIDRAEPGTIEWVIDGDDDDDDDDKEIENEVVRKKA